MSKLTDLTSDISRLTREKREAISAAYTWDNELAPQHNTKYKQAAEQKVRESYDKKIEELKDQAHEAAETAAAAGRRHRPTLDRNDSTAVANISMEWTNRVQPLLAAGKSLRNILEAGNVHTALAAEEYAAAWFQANKPEIGDQAFVARDVTHRLAELASTEAATAAILDAASAESDITYFNNALASGERGDSLDAAVIAHFANSNEPRAESAEAGESQGGLEGAVSANYTDA